MKRQRMRPTNSIRSSSWKECLFFGLAIEMVISLTPSVSRAGVGIAAGVSYPTPLGYTYQTLSNSSIGGTVEVLVGPAFLGQWFQFHFAGFFDPFTVRNVAGLGLNMAGVFAGMQAQAGEYGKTFTSFVSLDVGGVYDWIAASGASYAVSSSSIAFANQVTTGFDVPIVGGFGLTVALPVRFYWMKTFMAALNPTVSVRFHL